MTLDKILKSMRQTGLCETPEEIVLITDEPKTPAYLCFPSEESKEKYDSKDSFGQGFDPNRTKAKIKSVGEFLERLCLYNFNDEKMIITKFEGDKRFIDPALFCCYSNNQLGNKEKYLEETRSSKYRWWPVKNLITGEKHLIPAQMIFLSSSLDDEFEIRKERISTGAALGKKGTDRALKSGLMESVERDACISAYLLKKEMSKIVNFSNKIQGLLNYLKRYQLETHIFDATNDLNIPSVLAITLDRTGFGSAVNVGSRADLNYEDAIKSAILESIHCRRTSRVMKEFQFPKELPSENQINSLDDRFYYWHSLERINDLNFWLNQSKTIEYKELIKKNTTFEKVVNEFKKREYHILVADITLPEIKRRGFETKKVIIPELHPLYLDEKAKSLYSLHHGEIIEDKTLKPHPLT